MQKVQATRIDSQISLGGKKAFFENKETLGDPYAGDMLNRFVGGIRNPNPWRCKDVALRIHRPYMCIYIFG